MRIVTLDFETFFSGDYTLKKLTTEQYVRDERFEAHGAAWYEPPAAPLWFSPVQLKEVLESASQPGREPIAMIFHHAHFDAFILNHHFDYRPGFILDTLSMARVCFDSGVKLGLGDLVSRFGLTPKSVPYDRMKGKHWHEMDPQLQRDVAEGGMHDCVLTRQIADYMLGTVPHPVVPYPFPARELPVVDLTVRMFSEPCLVADVEALGAAWIAENEARQDLFARLGTSPSELRKDASFAAMLESLGVEPPTKVTTKGNEKFAFAKSDYFMQDLLASDDPDVALLAEARLKAQSSIYQTRCERLGDAALRGPLPVYLGYAAAHTRRWGGGDKMNWQNFPRPNPARPQKGALRRAIKAP